MVALLRVCRNVIRRFFPHLMGLAFIFFAMKVMIMDPWNAKWERINHEMQQLQQNLAQKDEALTKLCQNNVQQAVDSAIEKERTNTQRLVESTISTNLAQHATAQNPMPTQAQQTSAIPTSNWEKAWPIIEQRFHSSQPWADVLPQANVPEDLKRSTPAPTREQLFATCREATPVLDDTPTETSSSWLSSMIRVRRLDNMPQHATNITELLQKNAWQEALTQLEGHPHHDNPKIKALIDQLRDRLRYEQAFTGLTTWKQQLCATSAPS